MAIEDREDFDNLMQRGEIPSHARLYITIPSGGDYSGEELDLFGDVPLEVTWEEEETL